MRSTPSRRMPSGRGSNAAGARGRGNPAPDPDRGGTTRRYRGRPARARARRGDRARARDIPGGRRGSGGVVRADRGRWTGRVPRPTGDVQEHGRRATRARGRRGRVMARYRARRASPVRLPLGREVERDDPGPPGTDGGPDPAHGTRADRPPGWRDVRATAGIASSSSWPPTGRERSWSCDTVASLAGPGFDENSGRDMATVLAALRRLGDAGATVAACHHPAKHGEGTGGIRLRGHSSLWGEVDGVLEFTRPDRSIEAGLVRIEPKDGDLRLVPFRWDRETFLLEPEAGIVPVTVADDRGRRRCPVRRANPDRGSHPGRVPRARPQRVPRSAPGCRLGREPSRRSGAAHPPATCRFLAYSGRTIAILARMDDGRTIRRKPGRSCSMRVDDRRTMAYRGESSPGGL